MSTGYECAITPSKLRKVIKTITGDSYAPLDVGSGLSGDECASAVALYQLTGRKDVD